MRKRELVRYRASIYDNYHWRDFVFRPGDIVISTPPKCGTTWMQMICAMLIFQEPVLTQPLSVHSPFLDTLTRSRRDVLADLEAQKHRRFIKTHTPLDGLPLEESVTYICVGRDPRDAALSLENHWENFDLASFMTTRDTTAAIDGATAEPTDIPALPDNARERFWCWADYDRPGLASLRGMLHHLQTFWDAADGVDAVLLHYDDLLTDLEGQMRGLADRLGITVSDRRWPALVNAASFDEMRAQAALTAPDAHDGVWRDNQRFFNHGTSGQWRDLLDDDDLERYRARTNAIGSADVVDWVHRGAL